MAPLIVMVVAWFGLRAMGAAGVLSSADSWTSALRFALAIMFLFTAISHFHPRTRRELIQMVPPRLPSPSFLVAVTGALEIAGAIGLLIPQLVAAAAYGLIALMVALFPANMYAARRGLMIAGRRATPLVWRLPLQLFWIGALWWIASESPWWKR